MIGIKRRGFKRTVAMMALACSACAGVGNGPATPTVRNVASLAESAPAQELNVGEPMDAVKQPAPTRLPMVLTSINRPGDRLEIDPYDDQGKLIPEAHDAISRFLRCQRTGRYKLIHEGLVAIMFQISRDYPGKDLSVVSGIRWRGKGDGSRSPHWRARAVDLKVAGVSANALRKHMWNSYDKVAVGYYPHSGFVHVDVRDIKRDPPVRWIEIPNRKVNYATHTAEELASLKTIPAEFPLVPATELPVEAVASAHDHSH